MPFRLRAATLAHISLLLLGGLVVGCGGSPGTHVTGKVTFNGKPVPAGKVYIVPDSSKGNKGAPGYADIKDGTYDTAAEGGQGATPGPVIIAVEGIDPTPPPGAEPDVTTTVLFARWEKAVELPSSDSVQDLDVPPEAAKGPVAPVSNVVIP